MCLIMKIYNRFGSLGKKDKVINVELGSVEVVWDLGYQLEKSDAMVTVVFTGFEFEVMGDEFRMVKEKFDTSCWPAWFGTCNIIMTMLTGWTMGENEETYIDGPDADDIQTDTPT